MCDLLKKAPMIKINYKINDEIKSIYALLEYYSLTGSIKDRVAYYIIKNAIEKGKLKEKMPIIEATSGNTGIALAAIGKKYNHKVYIFMPDWVSIERRKIIESFGAKVYLVSKEEGGFEACLRRAKELSEKLNGFLANQFENIDNINAHYEITGKEIIEKLDIQPNAFVSGVGTGGTIMGTAKKLKEKYQNVKIIAVEPDKMPLLTKGEKICNHKIEGIGDDFIPKLLDIKKIDKVYDINDEDAVNMSRKLALELGLGVGISSGANFIGCILAQKENIKNVVTVFVDDNKKYLSTDLSKNVNQNHNFLSNCVKLLGYEVIETSKDL